MKSFRFQFPTEVIMGEGKLAELGSSCARFGKKAFLVFDPFLKGSQILDRIRADFAENGIAIVEFSDIVPNPRNTSIDAATEQCRAADCEMVVVIGGGSAIDTAKANALMATNPGTCWEYTERQGEPVRRPERRGLPLIVVPTTAGTGTESTSFSVINNPAQKRKCTIISPYLYPDVSLIDPTIMAGIPPHLTALTGLDTFAHALEAFISTNANPVTDMLALRSIELFSRSIRAAVKDGSDLEARADMAMSCGLGGLAIGNAGVTLPHAMGQPLGALTDAPHGGTLAACLPQVVAWTLPKAADRFAKVAELLDPKRVRDLPVEEQAAALPAILQELYADLGVDVSFGKYGLAATDIDVLVELCFKGFQQDINVHPRIATPGDVRELVLQCM